jgi:hypothetical protein
MVLLILVGLVVVALALVTLGVALMGKDIESDRRLLIVLSALPVLSAFAVAIVAILSAFGDSFE